MSDEDKDEVVTGAEVEAKAETEEVTPPPGESEEVVNLRKEVSGLKSAASSERHKRQTAESEIDRMNNATAKADFDPFDPEAINRAVDSRMGEVQAQAKQVEANKAWDERIEAGQKSHADVDIAKIIQDESFYPYISDTMAEVIRGSEDGIDVMLHLNANREVLQQIAQLSPVKAAQQMGVISQQLKANAKAEGDAHISNAPDPITPVGSRSVSEKDTDAMSPKEYENHMREKRGGSVFL